MSQWVSTWGQSHTDISHISPNYKDCTTRLAITSCLKGSQIRLRVANLEGKKPYTILQAAVQNGTGPRKAVTFSGKKEQTLEVGEEAYSDGIGLDVDPGDLIVISMAFQGTVISGNDIVECVQCSKKGNFVDAQQFTTVRKNRTSCYNDLSASIPALSSVEVLTEDEDAGAIVCFGDSITQKSTWTRPLMEACLNQVPGKLAVINKGINGNRLLSGPFMSIMRMYGRAGMERFRRDVLDEAGTKAVIIAMGTNDIGMARNPDKPDWITAEKLEKAMEELVQECHAKGIKVYGSTLLPRGGSTGYLEAAEVERSRFNEWMRSTDLFDGVLDFDMVVRDPEKPDIMAFACDSGDHLHPHFLGGQAMAKLATDALLKDVK